MKIKVTGLDPSFSNWGIAVGILDLNTNELTIDTLDVISPKINPSKKIRVNSKDLGRASQLVEGLIPYTQGKGLTFCEVPHGSQSARAMASYGVCIGLLSAIEYSGVHLIQVTAHELQMATIGKCPTKEKKKRTIGYMVSRYPDAPWPRKPDGSIITSKAEHMADAIGSIEAGMLTSDFKIFRQGVSQL